MIFVLASVGRGVTAVAPSHVSCVEAHGMRGGAEGLIEPDNVFDLKSRLCVFTQAQTSSFN